MGHAAQHEPSLAEISRPIGRERRTDAGAEFVVAAAAGPRLGGKKGIILGPGTTASQIRVLLDGSKGPLTLHARYVDLLKG